MVKVSVIVPVYNAERYLSECIESIASQSLDDIEIICVDDGSTDSSPDILRQYADKDSRIKILSQKNSGAGASRNLGLEHVTGEYVYFADSDDYLDLNALEELYGVACEKSTDFVMLKVKNFYEKTGEVIDDDYYSMPHLKECVGSNVFSYSDVSKMALELCVCPPGCFFKKEFVNDIRFPEGLLFEDNVFFTNALFKADRICFHDQFLYNRRRWSDSTTGQLSVRSLDTIEISNLLLDLCNEYGHPNHKKELYYRIFNNIYNIFKKANPSQKDEFFNKIKHDYLKSKPKWESDEYFKNELNPKYKHIFNCALKSKNAQRFEKCVYNYNNKSRLKRLRDKLL
ncbi:MAG: glycosyltransferase family 2 protein [Methanobrevibacter thaueri]|jgi:glycosyltransferase involved in cell wall biosynthesis|uniref:glycosyltransferase family 2 protein n=1 Tax=Methanobrevibacter thaueri TaxID=190975 RepID=UPI0026F1DD83|nr:glycosyltransferase family 2 protein [Methanobrevibacter thaueri]MBE6496077.1 glycosyltransferase family 2 protein [Methanobrevibacter thaueri]